MAKNVQGVLFLRNGSLYQTHEAALEAIEQKKGLVSDGEIILARYGSGSDVKTLVGVKYGNGNTSADTLTIIDIEGASADVEELRQEINAKLGDGVSSANTVTAQLTALSGNTASTSAETSVEGAKRYAEDLIGTLDHTDTAETGSYVSKVDQVDGIISTTKVALPSVTGEVESKKVVMSVSEDKGEISVDKGTIESSDKTVVISDVETSSEVTGIDFSVNIDNETLIADTGTGVISVASAALTQYVGDEDTIHISDVDESTNTKTISSPLTISATTPTEANVKEQYNLVGASGLTIGATIKIYKDSALLSVALLHAITTENPQVLPTYNKATDTWTDIDATAQTQANQALCYAYEDVSGNTVVAAVPVGSFINEQEFASGITWDTTENKVRGVVDPTSENFLTVGTNGFKLSGVQDAINDAIDALDATVNNNASSGHVAVEIVEENGVLTAVTVTEDDIASADDLAALSGKAVTEIASSNASISAETAATADGTVSYDLVTDASKIKMTGFTADASGFTAITSASTVTEAVKAIETEVIANEQTTAQALTDLDGRLDVIEPIYVSGVSVNGNAVTVADHIAPISITSATGATSAQGNAAITVDTSANGAITLGLNYIDCGTYDDEPQP